MTTDHTHQQLTRIVNDFNPYSSDAASAILADYVLIDRDDLPEAESNGTHVSAGEDAPIVNIHRTAPNNLRRRAYGYLALAEYLEAHPPASEADVNALADALIAAGISDVTAPAILARRLLATGRVKVVSE